MITLLFGLAMSAAPAPEPAPASKPVITRETRPDLFADEPPARKGTDGSATTPPNETPTSFWISNLLRTLLVLGAVVLLAYLILNKGLGRLLKITGVAGANRHMTLMERLPLDPRHSLYLVEVEGRRFVVGTADQSTTLIAALDEKGASASASAMTKPAFAEASKGNETAP